MTPNPVVLLGSLGAEGPVMCPACNEWTKWGRDWCGMECHYTFVQCGKCGARFAATTGILIRESGAGGGP